MVSRIDQIGQNGGDGEHYLVEKIARIIAGNDADMKMMGKNAGKRRWHLFIPMAIQILREIKREE